MKTNTISRKIKLIGILFIVLMTCIILTTIYLNNKNKKDALVINIVGKERMLTQKISKNIFYLYHNKSNTLLNERDAATIEFIYNLNSLKEGNTLTGIEKVPTDLIAYSTTKAALLAISRGLSHMTSGTGVTVNTIIPGSTLTEGAKRFLDGVAAKENKTRGEVEHEFFSKVRTSSLLERFASVEEIANTITYYASPLSAATNGAAIKLDGGSMGGII